MDIYNKNSIEKLSKREIEISLLILQGEKTISIAKKLGIKPNSVSTIKWRVYSKLGINSEIAL